MKLIDSHVIFFGEVPTEYSPAIKFIEEVGRVCYKSEDKITDKSAEPFVKKLVNAGHLAMLEHSNFVIRREGYNWFQGCPGCVFKIINKYFKIVQVNGYTHIGGNLTAWVQAGMPIDVMIPFYEIYGELFNIRYTSEYTEWEVCPYEEIPKEAHRYSAKFICDRGVSHELVRHRPTHMWQEFSEYSTEEFKSFAQESTRYVNYAGKDVEFIKPSNWDNLGNIEKEVLKNSLKDAYDVYCYLINDLNFTPQRARAILPNAIKTEVVVTADLQEWEHFFHLRCHKSAHPDMVEVATILVDKFQKRGLIGV